MSGNAPQPRPTLSGARFSASAEASRRAELERIRAMSPLERIALALALGRQARSLRLAPRDSDGHGPA